MGLKGFTLYLEGSGAVRVKRVLKATRDMYDAAGEPYGDICPIDVDWCTVAHLLDLDGLSDADLRLLYRALRNRVSDEELEAVLEKLDPLVTSAFLQLIEQGMHTTMLMEHGKTRYGRRGGGRGGGEGTRGGVKFYVFLPGVGGLSLLVPLWFANRNQKIPLPSPPPPPHTHTLQPNQGGRGPESRCKI